MILLNVSHVEFKCLSILTCHADKIKTVTLVFKCNGLIVLNTKTDMCFRVCVSICKRYNLCDNSLVFAHQNGPTNNKNKTLISRWVYENILWRFIADWLTRNYFGSCCHGILMSWVISHFRNTVPLSLQFMKSAPVLLFEKI